MMRLELLPKFRTMCRAAWLTCALTLAACGTPSPAPPAPTGFLRGERCLAELDHLGVQYQPAPMPAKTRPACEVSTPVRVVAATIPWNQSALASCGFVVEFDRFERQALQPLAKRYFGQSIDEIVHYGIYDCRTTDTGRPSEHAKGLAMDVAGFRLSGGALVMVEKAWHGHGTESRFLHRVALAACRYFNVVLDPDSDRDHWNHIHMDLGPYKLCVRR